MPKTFHSPLTLAARKERFPHAVDDISTLKPGQTMWVRRMDRIIEVVLKGFEFRTVNGEATPYMIFDIEVENGFATDRGVMPYDGKDWYNGTNMIFTSYGDALDSIYPTDEEIAEAEKEAQAITLENSRIEVLDALMPLVEALGYSREDAIQAMDRVERMVKEVGEELSDWTKIGNDTLEAYKKAHLGSTEGDLVRFPNRTEEEKLELFGEETFRIFNEFGVDLIFDEEFRNVMEFAGQDATDAKEFREMVDALYFAEQFPDLTNDPVAFFKSVRGNSDEPFKLYDYQKKALDDAKEWLQQQEQADVDEADGKTDMKAFRDAMEDLSDVLDCYDLPVRIELNLKLSLVDGAEVDPEALADLTADIADALDQVQ